MQEVISILMIIGAFSFAISGALTAMQKKFDIFGVVIIAFTTAVGGGTIRDILIDRDVFWLVEPMYIYYIVTGAIFAIIFRKRLNYLRKTLLVFDTVGLGLFTIIGVDIGLSLELSEISCVVVGVITGSFGGVMRDVLVNDIPVIFRKEIYATISIAGASLYLVLKLTQLNTTLTFLIPVIFIIILRFIVVYFEISLPNIYKKHN